MHTISVSEVIRVVVGTRGHAGIWHNRVMPVIIERANSIRTKRLQQQHGTMMLVDGRLVAYCQAE